jgi:hypothetical protein
MKRIEYIVVPLMLALFPHVAFAEWSKIAETNQSNQYLDRNSIKKIGGFYEAWWLMNLKPHLVQQVGFESVVGYEKIDCRKRQTLSLQKTTYNESFGGGVGNPDRNTYVWQPSSPGGLAENLIREICTK